MERRLSLGMVFLLVTHALDRIDRDYFVLGWIPAFAGMTEGLVFVVTPAEAGAQPMTIKRNRRDSTVLGWFPAFAGMTGSSSFHKKQLLLSREEE